ncbi:MAG: polyisoprenyl-phosphate glycosyltransferase [Patescibacteria group bacterium]|nr:glycosyltransferase family 2 protein [Candidatus Saccharibacteria bacterium]MDQ5963359.1 polyisoprenyl-phosphate glycosyltransferase [Patescibacteria group bacterium]
MKKEAVVLSVVVPVYNEAAGLRDFHASLVHSLQKLPIAYEILYINDGSTDGSKQIIQQLTAQSSVRALYLSRNFGKEIATTAGLQHVRGQAALMLDADGQHPVEKIGAFVRAWQKGAKVVVGVRRQNSGEGLVKRYGSKLFYATINRLASAKLTPFATDFRLVDREVIDVFTTLTEHNRITRGLIDWLGFERTYIAFNAKSRKTDRAGYSFGKLCKLAMDSVISLSTSPLYIAAYTGAIIIVLSLIIGGGMLANFVLHDPLGLQAHASAYGLVLILFLIGLILVFQGIIGLYLSHIHTETQNRPLYVLEDGSDV